MAYESWLSSGCIDMATIMGCESRVMNIIGDIAALEADKELLVEYEIHNKVSAIERKLWQVIESQQVRLP